jgi:hypothetical protein
VPFVGPDRLTRRSAASDRDRRRVTSLAGSAATKSLSEKALRAVEQPPPA